MTGPPPAGRVALVTGAGDAAAAISGQAISVSGGHEVH